MSGREVLPVNEEQLHAGLSELLFARICAEDVNGDPWWFAIEIHNLRDLQLTDTVLRWLVGRRYLLHQEEATPADRDERVFQEIGRFRFTECSCFVLTDAGLRFARELLEGDDGKALDPSPAEEIETPIGETPCWDSRRRELRFSGQLVKRYRVRSPNQEAVLSAFEEEGWPSQIFDPLTPIAEQCPKRRLHDTIKCLNRRHKTPLIRFAGDGTGEGVLWEPMER